MQLLEHTFLITGGGSGLGRACAAAFHAAGANVVVGDVNETAGTETVASLGPRGKFAPLDVTSEASVQSAVDFSRVQFGALHGVVQCAGILASGRLVGKSGPHDLALFRRVIEVNLIGTFNVFRLAAAAMQTNTPNAEGERGVLIATSSVAAEDGQIGQAAYAASKAGVRGLMLPLARELARCGIRAVAIAPGVFATPMMSAAPPELQKSLAAQIPFPPRFGQPAEFAQLARQIVENPYLNGTTLPLDGALRMGPK
ncbi:MAG TPA: SDR family NAD(P)-dependent oxidoreductase [Pirellulales bacterium]|jgi:NAD(P)-dependent dehydrogenase (short-subunit alcohol dehydrogenase family)|nr:SDR family NAD(P)-dependent oxidoreductase [Pirellulales bacterium]